VINFPPKRECSLQERRKKKEERKFLHITNSKDLFSNPNKLNDNTCMDFREDFKSLQIANYNSKKGYSFPSLPSKKGI